MQHLSLEEILQVEDGEGAPDATAHLACCVTCQTEQKLLAARRARLLALPTRHAPSDGWPAVKRALVKSNRLRIARVAMALAAGIAALVLAPLLARHSVQPERSRGPLDFARGERTTAPATSPGLAALIDKSKSLDEQLRKLSDRRVLSVATADTIVELEDQLAFIDQCIISLRGQPNSEEISALWKTRIELLEALIAQRSPTLTVSL